MGFEGEAPEDRVNGFAGRLDVIEGPSGRRGWPDDVKAGVARESSRTRGDRQRGCAPAQDDTTALDAVAAGSARGYVACRLPLNARSAFPEVGGLHHRYERRAA